MNRRFLVVIACCICAPMVSFAQEDLEPRPFLAPPTQAPKGAVKIPGGAPVKPQGPPRDSRPGPHPGAPAASGAAAVRTPPTPSVRGSGPRVRAGTNRPTGPASGAAAGEYRFDALRIDGTLHGPETLVIRTSIARLSGPLRRLERSFLYRILETVEDPGLMSR